jgi:hypothetical protein
MSCERDFFTLKGEKFTFSNNLWSKNPFAKVEKIPFAKESHSDDIGHWYMEHNDILQRENTFLVKNEKY